MSLSGGNASNKSDEMIVSITGATGFVGKNLVKRLIKDNHRVRVLTRSKASALLIFPVNEFPGLIISEESEWANSIQSSTAVVNLAGRSIVAKWTPEVKKAIKDSRIGTTSKVVELINSAPLECRPKVFVSGSASGYYGSSETLTFDEKSPVGTGYLAQVCQEWEEAAQGVNKDVRLALIRTGAVLGKDGGAMSQMIPIFKMFLGGPSGSGKQWLPWIHVDDLVSLICEALSNPSYKGAINGSAPNPVRSSQFCKELGSVLWRPSWLSVPEFVLKKAFGEGADVVLSGQKVLPTKALELGFSFKYNYVKDAFKDIVA